MTKIMKKIHIFWTTSSLKNKIHFPVRASRVSIAIWWWDQTDKILFFWKNIPPLGNTSPKSGEGGFCIIFQIWSNTGRPEKKVTIRMLLAPRCTGSIASSWHPESTFEIMGPLNTAWAYLCNTSKGLYKLLAPSGALIAIPTYYWPTAFSDHTGPQYWTFTFWATTAI